MENLGPLLLTCSRAFHRVTYRSLIEHGFGGKCVFGMGHASTLQQSRLDRPCCDRSTGSKLPRKTAREAGCRPVRAIPCSSPSESQRAGHATPAAASAALASGIVQEKSGCHLFMCHIFHQRSLNDACYPVVFSPPRHIRRTYFRHHLCDVSTMRSTGNRSVKRRQRGFGTQRDVMHD
jgi:hypothetical protein